MEQHPAHRNLWVEPGLFGPQKDLCLGGAATGSRR
jgi:hypothetical protein